MQEILYLESDEDFENLIPFIKAFSERAKVPFWQQLNEVSATFLNPEILVILGKREGKIIGYLCGMQFSGKEFMVTQIFSPLKETTSAMLTFMEEEVGKRGMVKVFGLSKHNPRIFEAYGFKIERYLISKDLKKEEK